MCMEDVRIGRELASTVVTLVDQIPSLNPVLGVDPNRVAIHFSGDGVNTFSIWPDGFAGNPGRGFTVTPTNPNLLVRVEEWGKLITGRWFASTLGAAPVLVAMVSSLGKQ